MILLETGVRMNHLTHAVLSTSGSVMAGVRFKRGHGNRCMHTQDVQVSLQLMQGQVGCRHN